MKKVLMLTVLFITCLQMSAQVEVAKIIGTKGDEYKLGYGAFLKIGYPISERSDISGEVGVMFFSAKTGGGDGLGIFPAKLGYRYILTGEGTGLYIEPQLGYNFYKTERNNGDGPFNGPLASIGTGYLFQPLGGLRFDLGLRYESIFYKGGSLNFIALRLTHSFGMGRREE